jgi:hypothetical protein
MMIVQTAVQRRNPMLPGNWLLFLCSWMDTGTARFINRLRNGAFDMLNVSTEVRTKCTVFTAFLVITKAIKNTHRCAAR